MRDLIGRTLGHYRIVEKIGAGGMGEVYRATDERLDRDVAIKVLLGEVAQDADRLARFEKEAKAVAMLAHPNILEIWDFGLEEGVTYAVTELLDGQNLRQCIPASGLPWQKVVGMGVAIADGLAAAHGKGIVHRDMKPENVFVTSDGRVKILDFGLAQVKEPVEEEAETATMTPAGTVAGTVLGTVGYMAPEQLRGESSDARTDIFALGCVLYEMLSGQPAFLRNSTAETTAAILKEEPPSLLGSGTTLPAELERTFRRCLEKSPEARFQSASDLAYNVRSISTDQVISSVTAPKPKKRPWVKRAVAGAAVAVVAAVVLVVAAVFVVRLLSRPSLAFASRDRLLIASVDNQTQDAAFDLALGTALEADLRQSRYAGVFDRGQVAQTLRLMRLDPSTPVDEELGRDICRFAGIRALLLSRILSVGEAYEIQVVIVDPVSGRHVESVRVTSRGREEVLLEGIDEVTREVRSRLGESLASIEQADFPIVQVTTSSWEALQYLAMGNMKWQESKYVDAAAMYELALQKDPLFVAAKGSLGLLQIQFLGKPDEGKLLLTQALEEGGDLPEREHLMIRAVHCQFVEGDLQGALDEYALIREIYPDIMGPYNNAGRILKGLGRPDEAAAMYERTCEVDRRDVVPLGKRIGIFFHPS